MVVISTLKSGAVTGTVFENDLELVNAEAPTEKVENPTVEVEVSKVEMPKVEAPVVEPVESKTSFIEFLRELLETILKMFQK